MEGTFEASRFANLRTCLKKEMLYDRLRKERDAAFASSLDSIPGVLINVELPCYAWVSAVKQPFASKIVT